MPNKPSYKEYVKSTILSKEWYFVYKENNKMYKEVSAFKARLKKEIILVIIPILILLLNYSLNNFAWYKSINNVELINFVIMILLPYIMGFLYLKRYNEVEFEEIQDVKEAMDTKVRFIEIILGLIYISEIVYVKYLIAIM